MNDYQTTQSRSTEAFGDRTQAALITTWCTTYDDSLQAALGCAGVGAVLADITIIMIMMMTMVVMMMMMRTTNDDDDIMTYSNMIWVKSWDALPTKA